MTPSVTTGICSIAAPINTPVNPAMSSPPTVFNMVNASASRREYFSIASSITLHFLFNASSVNPAPLPVTCSTSKSKSAAATAVLVVVFPIPISPVASISYPSLWHCCTSCIPVSIAFKTSSSVIAGSLAKFFVPFATFRGNTPGITSSVSIPMSTGTTSTPATAAIFPTEELFTPMAFATASVTSFPLWLTCSSTTPLSAHITRTAFF